MTTQQKICKYFFLGGYITPETGGGAFPTVIPNARPICKINIMAQPATNMDWDKCRQTPFEGPCWQHANEFKTLDEWNAWVKQHIESSAK